MTTVPVPCIPAIASAVSSARHREPGARQPLPVPCLRDGCRVDDCRRARLRHSPLRELVEIVGEQRQTVRRVSHQVAVDQHGADIGGDVVAHADPQQQLDRVRAERRGVVARGGIGCGERRHGGGAVRVRRRRSRGMTT